MTTCPKCGSSHIGHHVDTGELWCHGRKDKPCDWRGTAMNPMTIDEAVQEIVSYIASKTSLELNKDRNTVELREDWTRNGIKEILEKLLR